MKLFKNIFLLIIFLSLTATSQGQEKKSYAQKKAYENTEYVSSKMKFNDVQKTFLHEVLLNKYELNSKKNKDKNLSQEDKKAIYKQSYKDTTNKLLENFSKEDTDKINELLKAKNKENKK